MTKVKISLDKFDKIKKFIRVARSFSSDINIIGERIEIDGKSIMGLFEANLSHDVYAQLNSDDEAECKLFEMKMEEFR